MSKTYILDIKGVCVEDDEGRGEFDEETPILSAVDRTIEMFKENENEN